MDEYFAGQSNGLCGAGAPGGLFLNTGLHTGKVGFTVELHDQEPPADHSWEDVVEAPFRPVSPETLLVEWSGEECWDLELEERDYRVRYCAVGMDAARRQDTRKDGDPQVDRYCLQFWPAVPSPDHVIKQTSKVAAYWHDFARELPQPPTEEERALILEGEYRQHEQERAHLRQRIEASEWGGRAPSARLRRVGGTVMGMVTLDRALLDELESVPPATQRAIARWAARRAYAEAGLSELDWAKGALDALDRGFPLPPPFDQFDRAWDTFFEDERVPHTVVSSLDGSVPYLLKQAMALPAVFGAASDDPLRAALDALYSAAGTCGPDYPRLFREVRLAFPALRTAAPPYPQGWEPAPEPLPLLTDAELEELTDLAETLLAEAAEQRAADEAANAEAAGCEDASADRGGGGEERRNLPPRRSGAPGNSSPRVPGARRPGPTSGSASSVD